MKVTPERSPIVCSGESFAMVLLVETAWANLVLGNNGKGIQERPLIPYLCYQASL